ncbi:uncharacterized protein [Dermacentor andersoni]|uniref:uncharacterized protein isoform X3 n=1 Tax=Dermacentor andersoni TaxID=34620 RepID=UPI0024178460|nr:uncharacterized protein LOC129382452 isoform X3 [Dermacentor andersoni]
MRKMMYLRLTRRAAFIGEEEAKEEALKMSLGHEDDLSQQPEAQNPAQEQPIDYNATQQQPATAPVTDTVDVLVPAPTNRHRKRIKSISKNPPPQMDATRQEGGAVSPNRARRHRKKKHRQPGETPSPPQSGGENVGQAARELRRSSEKVATPGDHDDAPVETGATVSVAGFESDAKSMAQNQVKEGEVRRSLSAQGGDQQEKEAAAENQAAPGEDSIVAIFGGNGAYQRLSLGFAIMAYFAVAVHIFLDTVIVHDVRFACRPPSWANESLPPEDSWTTTQGWTKHDNGSACRQQRQPESGDVTAPCTAWLYANSGHHNNIVQEWDLVCSRQWLRPFTRFGFIAGGLIAWVLPFLIDRAGRRPIILLGMVMASASSLAIYFVKSVQLFMLLRCVLGMCLVILYITSFVLIARALVHGPSHAFSRLADVLDELALCRGHARHQVRHHERVPPLSSCGMQDTI